VAINVDWMIGGRTRDEQRECERTDWYNEMMRDHFLHGHVIIFESEGKEGGSV
jgi:hypothetical protein